MIEELNLCEMGQPSGADRDTYIFNYGKSRDSEIAQEMRINRMTEQARYDRAKPRPLSPVFAIKPGSFIARPAIFWLNSFYLCIN